MSEESTPQIPKLVVLEEADDQLLALLKQRIQNKDALLEEYWNVFKEFSRLPTQLTEIVEDPNDKFISASFSLQQRGSAGDIGVSWVTIWRDEPEFCDPTIWELFFSFKLPCANTSVPQHTRVLPKYARLDEFFADVETCMRDANYLDQIPVVTEVLLKPN